MPVDKGVLQRIFSACLLLTAAFDISANSLDEDMTALRDARDLSAIEQRMADATGEELNSPAGLRWQAWLARGRQDKETALALLERGLEIDPDNIDLILMRSGIILSGLSASGGLPALRQARAMSRELERAVELAPNHAGARISLVQYLMNAPRIAGGGSRKAREHMNALKDDHPASYLGLKAQSAMADDELDDALNFLEQAIEQDSGDDWRFLYSFALQRAERWDDARDVLNQMVEVNPRNGAAWYQLGRLSVLSETDTQAGRAALDRFVELPPWPGDPSHALAWWRIGQLHELEGQIELARVAYERSLTEDPELEGPKESLEALQG